MPIYEFYCPPCHTIYSFLSRRMQVPSTAACPKCGHKKLEKKVSRFAISKGLLESSQSDQADPFANLDESKLEELMSQMAPSMQDDDNQEDPKQMAHLMKRMFELTGSEPTGAMLEAIKRMEAGEDPDAIDEDLGSAIDEQPDPFSSAGSAPKSKSNASKRLSVRRLLQAPKVDPELYELGQ
ncbi:MAG: zinc ribbon domain-containing protein [Planctomycetota bacterium]|nr:zinc ribbon domain-containing protein [Planctomycetota bacterium]